MSDPHKPRKNEPELRPDATLVDSSDDAPATIPAVPVGKQTTRALPAQVPIDDVKTDPPTIPPPQVRAVPERARITGKKAVPVTTVPELGSPDQAVTGKQLAQPDAPTTPQIVLSAIAPLLEGDTRLNPTPARPVLGPTGTLDTDGQPAIDAKAAGAPARRRHSNSHPAAPAAPPLVEDAGRTFVGDETSSSSGSQPAPSSDSNPSVGLATHDFKPLTPTKTFGGFDEQTFRRGLVGIGAGAVLVVVLVFIWAMVKFDDAPLDPGKSHPIAHEKAPKQKDERAADAVVVPKPVMIEQTVDAGNGETRTVLAAAGTVRIVTDPDMNVFVEGKDLGAAPVLVTLPAGKNSVLLENKKLFFKRTVTVDVTPNEQTAVRFAFSMGWLELDAPAEAKVTIDGRPATGTHVQVWEGTHKVEAVHSDKKHTRSVQNAEVHAGMTTSVHFEAPSIADE